MIKLLYLEILHGAAGAREAFEDLCYELIRSQFLELEVHHVQRKQGDGGIDVYVGDLTDPHGIEVFQAKFFDREVGESQKDQIRKSFNRCITNPEFTVSKWTLGTAPLTGERAQATFRGRPRGRLGIVRSGKGWMRGRPRRLGATQGAGATL